MEFRGWRRYEIETSEGSLKLRGAMQEWTSPVMTAECFAGPISECPMETGEEHRNRLLLVRPQRESIGAAWHGCGIHSFKTLGALLDGMAHRDWDCLVYAEVVNYGRVDEFEHGYRAEHTRILKMYLTTAKHSQADYMEAVRRILETRFGVPVVLASLDDLIAEHAPDYQKREWFSGDLGFTFTVAVSQMTAAAGTVPSGTAFYIHPSGGNIHTWQTSASASSDTTTSPNRSQRRSGSQSPSSNPSPSSGSVVVYGGDIVDNYTLKNPAPKPKKKKPVEANLPANKKKWWLKR